MINLGGKHYRAPNQIPSGIKTNIFSRRPSVTHNYETVFLDELNESHIEEMVLKTAKCPGNFYVDGRSKKVIYRSLKFDQPIGYDPASGQDCHWLLVVAKSNSWIITAYPTVSEPGKMFKK